MYTCDETVESAHMTVESTNAYTGVCMHFRNKKMFESTHMTIESTNAYMSAYVLYKVIGPLKVYNKVESTNAYMSGCVGAL